MKTIKLQLNDTRWKQSPGCNVHLSGSAFTDGDLHREPGGLTALLPKSCKDAPAWTNMVSGLNGFFALVWHADGQLVAAVDRIRSMPLFYTENDGMACISDDAEWIRQQAGDDVMDPVARDEFRLVGHVTGRNTLYPNVKQLQAGELLIVDVAESGPTFALHRYFRYLHVEPDTYDAPLLREALERHVEDSFRRLIDYAAGRQIVVPLSGGYDSRLVVTTLSRLGCKNVLAFSYGMPGNKEAAYSKNVADALRMPWHFAEYSNKKWRDSTDLRRHYQKWASGWVSLPHIQDWLAVYDLQREGIIDRDAVFVPGHTCCRRNTGAPAVPARGQVLNTETLIDMILQRHYCRSVGKSGPDRRLDIWKERIVASGEIDEIHSPVEFASAFERWEWQERQAKFICNSVRVYEFFGYDWWMPLWDAGFIQFSQHVPLALRAGRRWYVDYIRHAYALQTGSDARQALDNAEDHGPLSRAARLIAGKLPDRVSEYLKALRYSMNPKRITDAFIVSHLPRPEIERLQREGYRLDGILVHEFLRSSQ